jgi:hypothetical protein
MLTDNRERGSGGAWVQKKAMKTGQNLLYTAATSC